MGNDQFFRLSKLSALLIKLVTNFYVWYENLSNYNSFCLCSPVSFSFPYLALNMYSIYVTNKSSIGVCIRVQQQKLSSANPRFVYYSKCQVKGWRNGQNSLTSVGLLRDRSWSDHNFRSGYNKCGTTEVRIAVCWIQIVHRGLWNKLSEVWLPLCKGSISRLRRRISALPSQSSAGLDSSGGRTTTAK